MPTIPNDGNMIMDWAHDQSVMDPLYETLMKRAVSGVGDLVGAGDPASEVGNLMNPMGVAASPLVSIYKDKASRIIETGKFIEAAKKLGGEKLEAAAKWFADNWPRTAAHKELTPETVDSLLGADAWVTPDYGKVKKKVPVTFSPEGLEKAKGSEAVGRDLFAHEGTHVAQNLGNSDFADLYNAVNQVRGYGDDMPIESVAFDRGRAAYNGERRAQTRMMRPEKSYSQMQTDLSKQFKDMGYSLDISYGAGQKPKEVRLRKWGTDASNPANYVNPTTLDLPKDMAYNYSLLEEGIDAYNKAGTRRNTSTRQLVDLVKQAKAEGQFPRYSIPSKRENAIQVIEDILKKRGMMDK